MLEEYLLQGLFVAIVLIISVRLLFMIKEELEYAQNEFDAVATIETLDPRPLRVHRTDDADDVISEETDENNINTV